MKKLSYKEMMYLKDIGLFSYGYAYLIRYLSKEEESILSQIGDIKERVDSMLSILNDRKSLPEDYSKFVENYKGFSGLLIPNEEIFF